LTQNFEYRFTPTGYSLQFTKQLKYFFLQISGLRYNNHGEVDSAARLRPADGQQDRRVHGGARNQLRQRMRSDVVGKGYCDFTNDAKDTSCVLFWLH